MDRRDCLMCENYDGSIGDKNLCRIGSPLPQYTSCNNFEYNRLGYNEEGYPIGYKLKTPENKAREKAYFEHIEKEQEVKREFMERSKIVKEESKMSNETRDALTRVIDRLRGSKKEFIKSTGGCRDIEVLRNLELALACIDLAIAALLEEILMGEEK